METHTKVLGVLNIISGVLGLCLAFVLVLVFGGVRHSWAPKGMLMPSSSRRSSG